MASVKELKRELKRWKKRAESALDEVEGLRKRLRGMDRVAEKPGKQKPKNDKGDKRDKKNKKGKGSKKGQIAVESADVLDLHKISGAASVSDQREAWKRHSFLRDRYEFHMADGHAKPESRILANRDLEKEYGASFGFSAEQLDDILT